MRIYDKKSSVSWSDNSLFFSEWRFQKHISISRKWKRFGPLYKYREKNVHFMYNNQGHLLFLHIIYIIGIIYYIIYLQILTVQLRIEVEVSSLLSSLLWWIVFVKKTSNILWYYIHIIYISYTLDTSYTNIYLQILILPLGIEVEVSS